MTELAGKSIEELKSLIGSKKVSAKEGKVTKPAKKEQVLKPTLPSDRWPVIFSSSPFLPLRGKRTSVLELLLQSTPTVEGRKKG